MGPDNFFSLQRISQRDVGRDAIGHDGSNCFSRSVRTSMSKETLATCDFHVCVCVCVCVYAFFLNIKKKLI